MKVKMNGFVNDMGYVESYNETFEGEGSSILDVVCDWLMKERDFGEEDTLNIKRNVNKGWMVGCEWVLSGNKLECKSDVMTESFEIID